MRAFFVALLLLGACSVSRPSEDASGEEIYTQLCANCHGVDLEGGVGPLLGPGSNAAGQPDSFLETSIVAGRGRMPSFGSVLNQTQVDRLIEYIREIQTE